MGIEFYAEILMLDDSLISSPDTWSDTKQVCAVLCCELNDFRLGGVQLKPVCLETSENTGHAVFELVKFYSQFNLWLFWIYFVFIVFIHL